MTSSHDQYGADGQPSADYRTRELQSAGEAYKRQYERVRDDLTRALDENAKLRADRDRAEERARGYADELGARADDLAFCDALRAFLFDDWSQQWQLGPLLGEALDIDPARVYLDIRKGEIHFVIRADGEGGERWDDYARGRGEQIDPAPLAARLDARSS